MFVRALLIFMALYLLGWSPTGQEEEHLELGPIMGNLHRYSQKLGYSIEGNNSPLASFYMQEIKETLEELIEINPVIDSIYIANPIQIIMMQKIEWMEVTIEQKDWKKASKRYEELIEACNRCHSATEHEFIQIIPVKGHPIYNQKFDP